MSTPTTTTQSNHHPPVHVPLKLQRPKPPSSSSSSSSSCASASGSSHSTMIKNHHRQEEDGVEEKKNKTNQVVEVEKKKNKTTNQVQNDEAQDKDRFAQSLERQLKQLEAKRHEKKRPSKSRTHKQGEEGNEEEVDPEDPTQQSLDRVRGQLCRVLADLVVLDPAFAVHHGSLDRLWRACFYRPIAALRQQCLHLQPQFQKLIQEELQEQQQQQQQIMPLQNQMMQQYLHKKKNQLVAKHTALRDHLHAFVSQAVTFYEHLRLVLVDQFLNLYYHDQDKKNAHSSTTNRKQHRNNSSSKTRWNDNGTARALVACLQHVCVCIGDLNRYAANAITSNNTTNAHANARKSRIANSSNSTSSNHKAAPPPPPKPGVICHPHTHPHNHPNHHHHCTGPPPPRPPSMAEQAETAYRLAAQLGPGHGHALNQLGVLMTTPTHTSSHNHHPSQSSQPQSVVNRNQATVGLYWYVRAGLVAHTPFDSTPMNLQLLFAAHHNWRVKQNQKQQQLEKNVSEPQPHPQSVSTAIHIFLAHFVSLHAALWKPLEIKKDNNNTHTITNDHYDEEEEEEEEGWEARLDLVLTAFTPLLQQSSMGDALLLKMITIQAFAEQYDYDPPHTAAAAAVVNLQRKLAARTATLALGVRLAQRVACVWSTPKNDHHRSSKVGEGTKETTTGALIISPAMIRLIVPLMLWTEYIRSSTQQFDTWLARINNNPTATTTRIIGTAARVTELTHSFWNEIVIVWNWLEAHVRTLQLQQHPLPMPPCSLQSFPLPLEYQHLVGFLPFVPFIPMNHHSHHNSSSSTTQNKNNITTPSSSASSTSTSSSNCSSGSGDDERDTYGGYVTPLQAVDIVFPLLKKGSSARVVAPPNKNASSSGDQGASANPTPPNKEDVHHRSKVVLRFLAVAQQMIQDESIPTLRGIQRNKDGLFVFEPAVAELMMDVVATALAAETKELEVPLVDSSSSPSSSSISLLFASPPSVPVASKEILTYKESANGGPALLVPGAFLQSPESTSFATAAAPAPALRNRDTIPSLKERVLTSVVASAKAPTLLPTPPHPLAVGTYESIIPGLNRDLIHAKPSISKTKETSTPEPLILPPPPGFNVPAAAELQKTSSKFESSSSSSSSIYLGDSSSRQAGWSPPNHLPAHLAPAPHHHLHHLSLSDQYRLPAAPSTSILDSSLYLFGSPDKLQTANPFVSSPAPTATALLSTKQDATATRPSPHISGDINNNINDEYSLWMNDVLFPGNNYQYHQQNNYGAGCWDEEQNDGSSLLDSGLLHSLLMYDAGGGTGSSNHATAAATSPTLNTSTTTRSAITKNPFAA